MSVRFILGRAGSGKTRFCVEQIESLLKQDPLGPPIFWLLPRQATFQAQRQLVGRLGAFARIHVVGFDDIGKEILANCGDVGVPEVTAMGRRLIVGHLLRKHQKQLKFYSASARRPGLAAEIDATFGELARAGLDATALGNVVRDLEAEDDAPHQKLNDVHLLMDAYDRYIGQDRLDPQRRLKLVLDRVGDCSLLKDAILLVDDFFDFTAFERKLLVGLSAAVARTEITLLLDPQTQVLRDPHFIPDDLSLFHRTEHTYRSLLWALNQAEVAIQPPLLLHQVRRFSSVATTHLEKALFDTSAQGSGNLELLDAPDARSEVDAIARKIRHAITHEGLRLRDIAVLTRNLESYQELIDASFKEHQFLPYFVDRRRTAAHHPLLQFLRACLLIVLHRWPHDAVMTLLKSGLAGVSADQADELENYVLRHRIRGQQWTSKDRWGFERRIISDEDQLVPGTLIDSTTMDAARQSVALKLATFLDAVPRDQAVPVGQIIALLFELFEAFGVRTTLAQWMAQAEASGQLEQRDEHQQVWTELVELLRQMNDLLGPEAMTLGDFLDVLDSGLEQFDLALTPPTVDQVLVGQIDRTRTPPVKLVFVLGMNEGEFPRLGKEDCVLPDAERRVLRKRKIDLDPEVERRLLDERFLAYVAFTRSSDRLVVSRALVDASGRPSGPSAFWNEMLRLFPETKIEHTVRSSQSDLQSIGTPRQLVTALMRWVRKGVPSENPWPSVYQWLAEHAGHDDAIDIMRHRAWKALSYANSANLSPELANNLFPTPLSATVAQIETYAACPFQHFVRFGLNLRQREEIDVTSMDLGRAYHLILENLVGDVLRLRKDWCALEPSAAAEMIRAHAAEVGRTLRGELMLSTARNRYLLDRIDKTLAAAVESHRQMHLRGIFRPRFAALKFGPKGKLPAHAIITPTGKRLELRGQIDRVDVTENGQAFAVADYKMSAGPLMLDRVYHGITLQLLVYLMVVQANGQELTGRKIAPAAAFFLQLLRGSQTVEHPAQALSPDHPDFHLRLKPRGLISESHIKSLDMRLEQGRSAVVQVHINQDGQLGNRHQSDAMADDEFAAILKHVEKRLGELADQLMSGDISITPYWIGRETPCPRCVYRSVCRFEPGINQYHILPGMKRLDVLAKLTGDEHAQ